MGSKSDVSEVLSQCSWSEDGSYLGEVTKSQKFPIVVRVLRGQYQNVGQPSFSNPTLVSYLLLVSAGKQLSVAAQCVKFKNQRQRVVPFGPTLAIPRDFHGHFEILSEDGKSVPYFQSVEFLLQKFPDSCLLREPIKAYRPVTNNNPSGSVAELVGVVDSGQHFRVSEKTRILPAGEVLVLVGEVSVPSGRSKVSRYLRCFDSQGQTVYLASTQKGKFSPLARHDSISGVHTTKNILNKRMPMMVRLVDGKPPVTPSAKNTSFKFVPELRLLSTIQEELIFGMPLSQNPKELSIIPLPLSVPLKFQVCRNMDQVDQMKEFCRLHEKIKMLVDTAKNFIQIYDINLKKELRFDGRQWKAYTPPIYLSSSQPLLAASSDSIPTTSPTDNNYEVPDVQDYEDIDDLYDYVRGVKPQPQQPMTSQSPINNNTTLVTLSLSLDPNQSPSQDPIIMKVTTPTYAQAKYPITTSPTHVIHIGSDERPPEPPPIETIPTHKPKIGAIGSSGNGVKGARHVTMVMTNSGNHHYHALAQQLGSNGSSPNNTSSTSSGEDIRRKRKHLYVKKQSLGSSGSHSQNNLIDSGHGMLSGSPSNRLLFRRSPIFDFRYKSMNDLNKSSLESRASSGQSNVGRYFQPIAPQHHNKARVGISSNNLNLHCHGPVHGRSKGIFRPKSLTNIMALDDAHAPLIPSMDIIQKISRSGQAQEQNRRKIQPSKLYL